MIILTGANSDIARKDDGTLNLDIEFRFSSVINATVRKARELGYTADVYDLGTLGIGKPFRVENSTFIEKGHYDREVVEGYKSKSLFKPAMVKACIEEHNDLTVYIDGDAQLRDSISEVDTDDYDVGVTVRDKSELESEWHKAHFEIAKFVNAGVIFFNPTTGTKNFLDDWEQLTEAVGNDQMALNKLTCPDHYPEIGSIKLINGIRIKYFPCSTYNYYYFGEKSPTNVKIMHFKGVVRHFYPFNLRTYLYCIVKAQWKNLARLMSNRRLIPGSE